jgi:hypothetical protein
MQTNDDVINMAVTLGNSFPKVPKILPGTVDAAGEPSSRDFDMALPY